jgi:hypothetical protein
MFNQEWLTLRLRAAGIPNGSPKASPKGSPKGS